MKLSQALIFIVGGLSAAGSLLATPAVTSPGNYFGVAKLINQSNIIDAFDDQQTGDHTADIVGNFDPVAGTGHPGWYIGWDGGTGSGSNDDSVLFRIRFGAYAEENAGGGTKVPVFKSVATIGIDGNRDGAIDLFIRNNGSASGSELSINNVQSVCSTCNTGPNNTNLGTVITTYARTTANYNFQLVNATIDPTYAPNATVFDVDGDGTRDSLLTFAIPLQPVLDRLNAMNLSYAETPGSPINFTSSTPLRFLLATSQNTNNFNQDLGGCSTAPTSWNQCGLTSDVILTDFETPEPGTIALVGLSVPLIWYARRRKAK